MKNKAKTYQQIIAKCWADDAFKQRLIADPAATLQAEGMTLPQGIQIEVRENTDQQFYLVIPTPPSELSDQQMDAVNGGFCAVCHCAFGG